MYPVENYLMLLFIGWCFIMMLSGVIAWVESGMKSVTSEGSSRKEVDGE